MGAWGVKLYDDDVTCDIKEEYIRILKETKDNEETLSRIIRQNRYAVEDATDDDTPLFWFALADVMHDYGRLIDEVKEQALYHIKTGKDLNRWKDDPIQYSTRKKVLEKLESKLKSPQPQEKKLLVKKPYINDWKLGDIYYMQIDNNALIKISDGKVNIKREETNGQYLLFQKVSETTDYESNVLPLVRVKITKNRKLPQTKEEFDVLEYIQIHYEYNFDIKWHIGVAEILIKGDKAENFLEKNRYLPIYRIELGFTSTRSIPKNMKYLVNYQNVKEPAAECIIDADTYPHGVYYKFICEILLIRYYSFNLNEINMDRVITNLIGE